MAAQVHDIYASCVLPPGSTAIRVLDLSPGNEDDDIHADMRVVSLDTGSPAQYECLSYVWGEGPDEMSAIVNGQLFPIKKNLHDALRYIRSNTTKLIVWVDAICINQADLDEKSSQVALMTEVYRQCSRVYIWLGVPRTGSLTGSPFAFLDHFISGKHFYEFPGFEQDEASGDLIWGAKEECDNILDDFLQFAESPWWTRAWTVQECLLPQREMLGGECRHRWRVWGPHLNILIGQKLILA